VLLPDDLDQHPLALAAVKLPVEYALPRAKVETAIDHRDHHFAAHHAKLGELRSASGARRRSCPSWTGVLAGAVVQPAQRPASSLINTLAVMCIADTRFSAFLVVYHSPTPDGRSHCGHRPCSEQLRSSHSLMGNAPYCHSACRCCIRKADSYSKKRTIPIVPSTSTSCPSCRVVVMP
jgi:hypothetical protein